MNGSPCFGGDCASVLPIGLHLCKTPIAQTPGGASVVSIAALRGVSAPASPAGGRNRPGAPQT